MRNPDWTNIALFDALTAAELERVKPIFEMVKKESGEIVLAEGERGDEMFILIDGSVRITKSMIINDVNLPLAELENPRKILATLNSSRYPIFGEIAMLDSDVRSATVEALEGSHFLMTSRDSFFRFIQEEPAIGVKLFQSLGARLATTVRKNNSELIKLTTALALALSQPK